MKINLKFKHKGAVIENVISAGQMVTVGRSGQCECQIDDDKMSGRHCRFFLRQDKLELSDLDSKNGTYLNGIRVEQSEIFVGDEIRIGDTIITFEEESFDSEALQALTFPGPHQDRLSYELKADFTGARLQNQKANKKLSVVPKVTFQNSHDREINARLRAKSRIRISKEEIKSKNKVSAFLATAVDALLVFFVLSLPIILTNKYFPELEKSQRTSVILGLEVIFIVFYTYFNFRKAKFTLGEKIVGIDKIYTSQ